ncbi:hypothetical protein ACF1AX_31235 [Streptomyces sp. NPDC014802]|uniref:hypothetical protein n=1 Tax=Streptomyces sp. NPDC014802 TaxID=3364917 RepID=UPI003701FE29
MQAETVLFEVRDPETGGIGSEVMCCLCGKEQWRWGVHSKFWARETHRELIRSVLVNAWLAAHIIQSATTQLALFEQELIPR